MSRFRVELSVVLALAMVVGAWSLPLVGVHATSITVSYSTNDGTTLTTVNALTANGTFDVALTGSPTWNSTQGVNFNMYSGNQYGLATFASFPTASFTIEIWLVPTQVISETHFLDMTGIQFYFSSHRTYFTGTGGATVYGGYDTITPGQLADLVIVVNSTDYGQTYVNGTVSGTAYGPITFSGGAKTLNIGRYQLGGYYFNGTIYRVKIFESMLNSTQLVSEYAAGIQNAGLMATADYRFDEGTGTVVYGYDKTVTLTTTPTATTISQTASAVNSSIIDTNPFPISNATDKYTVAAGFFDRVNGSGPYVASLTHSVYLTFAGVNGNVNQTTGWFTTWQTLNVLFTPYLGYQFANFSSGASMWSLVNPLTFYLLSAHTITGYGETVAMSAFFPLTWLLFFVWLAFMFLFKRFEFKFLAGIFGVMLACQTFGGEYWLTTGLSAVRSQTIFSIPLALFEVAFSTIVMFNVLWAVMHKRKPEV